MTTLKEKTINCLLKVATYIFGITVFIFLISQSVFAKPFVKGDVFAAVGNGLVYHYSSDGTFIESLNTGCGGYTTGMAFDSNGNLYVTCFSASKVAVFDKNGTLIGTFGSGNLVPESIVFDRNGNAYVGNLNNGIREYDPSGKFIRTIINTRVDWFDITSDNKTIYFTQEQRDIKTVDIATGKLGLNFTTGSAVHAYALRILPDGGVLLADTNNVKRYDNTGKIIQTYSVPNEYSWFSLNLDSDGTSFWSGDYYTGKVYKFDISTGRLLQVIDTKVGYDLLFGVVVYGEHTAAEQAATNIKVIDTISTDNNELDTNSFSNAPMNITNSTHETTVEWDFAGFYINETQDITFDVVLKNPVPGEDRLINNKLDLIYTDINGNPITAEIGPQYVHVMQSAFTSSIATDKSAYQANENVVMNAAITNLSAYERTINATVLIEDSQGNLVAEVTTLSGLDFTIGETQKFNNIIFNTGTTYPGNYRAHLILYDNQTQVGEAITSFTILSSGAITGTAEVSCGINTDKISYNPNEIAVINGTVNNLSINTMLSGDSMEISVLDPSGTIVGGYSASIPLLMPNASFSSKYNWNTGTSPAGTYQAVLKVLDSTGTLLTQATTSFGINSTSANLSGITGIINIVPQSLESNNSISVNYSITNNGNAGVTLTPSVVLISPQTQQPFTISTTNANIPTQGTYNNNFSYPVSCSLFGDYIVALKASDTKTVAQSWFRVVDLTPPVVSITGVVDNGCYNTPSPDISITDCHLSSQSILLNGNSYISGMPISVDNNYVLVATGTDLGGNVTTKSVHFTVDTIAPTITITGVTNGVTYTASVTPVITISDANLVSSTTTLDGKPYISGTPITAQGKHTLSVSASDCAGNQSSKSVSFTVISVKLNVIKSLITPPGVLIFDMDNNEGAGCDKDKHDRDQHPGQLISELTTLLTNAGYYYTVTDTWDEFEAAFDTGLYNRYILISLSSDDGDVERGNGFADKLDSGFGERSEDHDLIQDELREAVNMGDGLIVIKSNPDDLPWLKDVTGVQWLGQEDDEQKTLGNIIVELQTALSPSGGTMTLTDKHTGVNMTLTTANMAGYYSQTTQKCGYKHGDNDRGDCKCNDDDHDKNTKTSVAMAMNAYGMGEAVSMGFDPSYISETTQAQSIILNTLSFVGPNYQYMPYRLYTSSTQGIQISVTNLGVAVGLNITESVPASIGIGQVFNNGTITDSTILWHYALPVSASATFSYTVTMPQTASSYTFTTGIWYNNGPQLTLYGSYPFTVTVTIEPKALLKQIISDVQSLRVKRTDEEDKEEVLELLNKLQTEQDTIQPQEAVEKLIKAIDELMEIKSASLTQIRLNLDVELRIYEVRITGLLQEH